MNNFKLQRDNIFPLRSPLYLVKVRLQASAAGTGMGTQYEYKNARDGLKTIFKEEGFLGMFRGAKVAVLRIATGSSVQLATYDTAKIFIKDKIPYFQNELSPKRAMFLHFVSAMVSGVLVCTAMNPADVMATRLYNQNSTKQLYNGIGDCFIKILRVEGIYGLYKGWWAHYLRVGPHTVFTFLFFEQLKRATDYVFDK